MPESIPEPASSPPVDSCAEAFERYIESDVYLENMWDAFQDGQHVSSTLKDSPLDSLHLGLLNMIVVATKSGDPALRERVVRGLKALEALSEGHLTFLGTLVNMALRGELAPGVKRDLLDFLENEVGPQVREQWWADEADGTHQAGE